MLSTIFAAMNTRKRNCALVCLEYSSFLNNIFKENNSSNSHMCRFSLTFLKSALQLHLLKMEICHWAK